MLPILQDLKYLNIDSPRVLVLVPTRELVIQVVDRINEFSSYINVSVLGVYGGTNINTQKKACSQGVDVIAKKDDIKLVAQCKKFTKAVGNKAVQEIVAGIKYYQADIGIVIAPNGFTKSAEKLAEANKIKLIHHSQIKDL